MPQIKIIAEAGVNHNGLPENAFKLVDAAAAAHADIVKFQTFRSSDVISKKTPMAAYQQKLMKNETSQLEMVKKLELSPEVHNRLFEYCVEKKIMYMSTPFDLHSIDVLYHLGVCSFKIPSGEITNLPYLRKIGGLKKDIIISTGMSTLGDIERALDVLEESGAPRSTITILHCTTEYPAPIHETNLRAMDTLRSAFPGIGGVGFSDHTAGITIPVAAAARGATVIEKHFTLDRTMEGPDHKASLEPDELAAMVTAIRQVERALGDGVKRPTPSERGNMAVARKSLVASRPIKAGEVFSPENVTAKRPGTGVSPMRWDEYMGRPAPRDYDEDELL
jgi:N,N'-diacetyllegionaminate synthase